MQMFYTAQFDGVVIAFFCLSAIFAPTKAACGGCAADSADDEAACPTSQRRSIQEVYYVRGGFWNTKVITRYRLRYDIVIGPSYCCEDYSMTRDGRCVKAGCGGCSGSVVQIQMACRRTRAFSRAVPVTISYPCGLLQCRRTEYRKGYYLQEGHTCCHGYTLHNTTCYSNDFVQNSPTPGTTQSSLPTSSPSTTGGTAISTPATTTPATTTPASVSSPAAAVPCGISKYPDLSSSQSRTPFIIGGSNVRSNEFPWQVSLRSSRSGALLCGGTLVDPRWVLTASHCLARVSGESWLYIVAGDHRLSQTEPTEQVGAVTHIRRDPGGWDLALLRLAAPLSTRGPDVRPACLPAHPSDNYQGRAVAISGWGVTGDNASPDVLQYVSAQVAPLSLCDTAYGVTFSNSTLCVTDGRGDQDSSSCFGDSGGPMVVNDNGVFTVVGVSSFVSGEGCAKGKPFGYTNVAPRVTWISDVINGE